MDGLFNEEDVELVKSVPLSHVEAEDVLFLAVHQEWGLYMQIRLPFP